MASDREPRDPFQPVDFAPVRIGDRRRTLDPLAVGAIIVAVGLLVAVIKPWTADVASVRSSVSPTESALATPSATPAAPVALDAAEPAGAVAMLAVLQPRDGWGIRVVLDEPASGGYVERWETASPTGEPPRPVSFRAVDPIRAIGVTAPSGEMPLAVRIWRRASDDTWRWMDARRPASDRPSADLLLLPPPRDGTPSAAWAAGRYRLDLLMGSSIARLDLSIEPSDGAGVVPLPMAPVAAPATGLGAWLRNVPTGPYVVADGVVEPLLGASGQRMGPAEAWLDLGRQVASATFPTATALGVLLPAGSGDASGIIRRLAPDPTFDGPVVTTGVRYDASNDPTPFLQFDAPPGEVWPAGVYAIEATWDGVEGPQAGTWHIELRPGDGARTSSLLDAARRYAIHAGSEAIVLSGAGRRQRDPAAAAVRALPWSETIGCDTTIIDETPAVLGLASGPDEPIESIGATLDGPDGRTLEIRLRVAPDVVPGLTLIAPSRGAAFAAGVYRLSLSTPSGPRAITLCLGTSPFSG